MAGKVSHWEIIMSSRKLIFRTLWTAPTINPKKVSRIWTSMKNNYGTVVEDATSRTQYRVIFGRPRCHK